MKILLIGNYPYLKSQSMDRFASLLFNGLTSWGHDVRLLKPPPLIGRLRPSPTGLGKWLGYLDRFIFFRPVLTKAVRWADVVHICDQANAMYIPWLKEKPHVVTCHDMLAIRSALGEIAEHQTGLTGRIYQRWILAGLKKFHHLICVSETTREDLLRLTGLAPDRVSVVRNGLNYPYRPMSERESLYHIKQMGLDNISPFFLNVGNNNWYKNKEGLLRIFGQMAYLAGDEQGNLVIVGAGLTERFRVLAQKIGICDRIRELSNVNNEQLCALYSAAEGLIFPSLFEGFGWPIIEAQACGCPVFTSNRRPMTDVGGDGAVYFDPLDETVAAEIINSSIKNTSQLIQRGFQNVEHYTAKEMISGYVAEYQQVLE